MASEHEPPSPSPTGPVRRPWRRYRPSDKFAIVPGLLETIEQLDRKRRYRSAMDRLFAELDRDPDCQHALRLAMLVVGHNRTAQLQAAEPLTPAYMNDRRLDPLFAVCDNCGCQWVPDNLLLAPMARAVVINPAGMQCPECDYTLCRHCLSEERLSVESALIARGCPRCGHGKMGPLVYPTGRAPHQMTRQSGRVSDAFIFREGPIAPDDEAMRALLEAISPEVLENGAALHGVSLFPWPEHVVSQALEYVQALTETGKLPPEALQHHESAHLTDPEGNQVFVIKLIRPAAKDVAAHRARAQERPDDPRAHQELAAALLSAGYYHSVGPQIQAAVALDPTISEATIEFPDDDLRRYNQAVAGEQLAAKLVAAGRLADAAARLEVQIREYPNWAMPYNDLGYCELQRGHAARALELLRHGIILGDPSPELYCNLGLAQLLIGNESQATAALREALRLDPEHANAKATFTDARRAMWGRAAALNLGPDEMQRRDILQQEWPCYRASTARTAAAGQAPAPPLVLRWQAKIGAIVDSSPAVALGRVYVGAADGRVICVDAFTGQLYWQAETGSDVISSPAVANERVYIGSDDGKLYCFDAQAGTLQWSFATQSAIASSPLVADGRALIASTDGRLYCLDLEGVELWRYEASGAIRSSPALYEQRVYLSTPGALICLDRKSGTLIWRQERGYDSGQILGVTPAVGPAGVYTAGTVEQPDGTYKGMVYCFGHEDGQLLWSFAWPTVKDGFQSSPALGQQDVYIFGMDGLAVAFKQRGARDDKDTAPGSPDGVVTWYNQELFEWWMLASPAVGGEYLYQCVNDGRLYCLAAETGQILWSQQIDAETEGASSSPALAYERLYIGTSRNGLLCFSAPPPGPPGPL